MFGQHLISPLWVTEVVGQVEEIDVISHLTPRCGRWWYLITRGVVSHTAVWAMVTYKCGKLQVAVTCKYGNQQVASTAVKILQELHDVRAAPDQPALGYGGGP
jgi:hypothetical protein